MSYMNPLSEVSLQQMAGLTINLALTSTVSRGLTL